MRPSGAVSPSTGWLRGREAGFPQSGVVVTAQFVLDESPSVVHVGPEALARIRETIADLLDL